MAGWITWITGMAGYTGNIGQHTTLTRHSIRPDAIIGCSAQAVPVLRQLMLTSALRIWTIGLQLRCRSAQTPEPELPAESAPWHGERARP